jgi:hypothetical protein
MAGAKVDLPDDTAIEHTLHRAFDEYSPLMKDGNNAANHFDELHVVLDDDEAGIEIYRAQQIDRPFNFVGGHPGRWLIKQYEFRLLRNHHADLDPLPLTVRERSDFATGDRLEAELGQQTLGHSTRRACANTSVRTDPKVLVHREAVPDAWHLVLDAHAEPRDLVPGLAGDVFTIEKDGSFAWVELTAEHLEECALAGAIRPDQAAQFSAVQAEIDLGDRMHAAEIFAQAPRLQQQSGGLRSGRFAAGKFVFN